MSNSIHTIKHGQWKDYANQNKKKVMELDGGEFIRRFLLHVLPLNFMKIRHYGILSNRNKKTKLVRCKEIFNLEKEEASEARHSWEELILEIKGIDVRVCPVCKTGRMIRKEGITPKAYSPPNRIIA
ncbi:transposase [Desulfitobacterium sp. LBE]|uniref:transposase n=1 Tax=Desulfitobacterium sp. LBE TaxID=884086 RepID=UPI0011AA5E86|nr:transposase [Desulfitobacterium sp. LBE]